MDKQRNRFGRGYSRRKDLLISACFKCHKEEYRAWKHNERNPQNNRRQRDWINPANVNNADIGESFGSSAKKLVGPPKRNDCTPQGPEKRSLETLVAEVRQLSNEVRGTKLDRKRSL